MIKQLFEEELPAALEVIHSSFATVAAEFKLTRENCPKHTSFIPQEYLTNQYNRGWTMFGLYENGALLGYASLSKESEGIYELHNLAVLPECRHKGYGKTLINYAKEKVREFGGHTIKIGIIEENTVLKNWYTSNGFTHTGTKKFDHLPFTAGYMEWRIKMEQNENWLFAASGVVVRDGAVLLVRHTYGSAKGKLLIPGGHCKNGEMPEAAASREVLEETGVSASVVSLLAMRFGPASWYPVFIMKYESGEPV
ncbi:MAG: bifunctional GNAT family N-acetyltransferase/NUDIX hydrolase, partial [Eubacteriales bacterium]|nr:bifunctional GNAT family N-acetyltransferase/NUDIX hydrolase [Eubacteriales bacterium]